MHRFYVEEKLGIGTVAQIGGEEARHIRTALRMKPGDFIHLFDGSGYEFEGRIDRFGKDTVIAEITSACEADTESPLEIVLGQGIPKSDKMDLIVQKSTELGISRIVPVFTDRVIAKSFSSNKLDRWRRIATEACKQSGRVKPPIISEPEKISEFIAGAAGSSLKIIPWEEERQNSLKTVLPSLMENQKVSFMVGPEGGLTADEIELARIGGFIPVSLGRRILRTETVSISILSIIQYQYGDFSLIRIKGQ